MDDNRLFSMEEMEKVYREHVRSLAKQRYLEGEDIVLKFPEGSLDNDYRVPLAPLFDPRGNSWVGAAAYREDVDHGASNRLVCEACDQAPSDQDSSTFELAFYH